MCAVTPASQEKAATTSNPEDELHTVSQGTCYCSVRCVLDDVGDLDMTCLVLGIVIDASFLTVFFDH